MRITTLDSLRGVAALTVLLHHLYATLPDDVLTALTPLVDATPLRVVQEGRPAVIFFFVLSGFVLTLPFLDGRQPGYPRFLMERACRVYLPFAVAILLAAAVFLVLEPSPLEGVNRWIDAWSWSPEVTLDLLAAHLLMTGGSDAAMLDGTLWSLVHGLRIFALLPLLVLLGRLGARRALVLALVLFAVVGVGLEKAGVDPRPLYGETPWQAVLVTLHFVPFVLFGIVLALHGELFVAVLSWVSPPARVVLWTVAAGAMMAPFDLANAAGATLLMALTLSSPVAQRLLATRGLEWLGRVSYSLYLTHLIVLLALLHLLHGVLPLGLILVVTVPASLVVAQVFHRRVERPAMELGRRFAYARAR